MEKSLIDLFGNAISEDEILRETFIEPPFSVLDTKSGSWQNRKRLWIGRGLKSEVGRNSTVIHMDTTSKPNNSTEYISIFDPVLCEVLYKWFCPENGNILDPFCGGSVRGIVAQYLGYYYTGFDIRQEQIDSNREQALNILEMNNQPNYYVGDSNLLLDNFNKDFDFLFSCPPYGNLEVYSNLNGDISNKNYPDFLNAYESIINKSCKLLKKDSFACFVVGEFRDEKGFYRGFVSDTVKIFEKCGMKFYNDAILLNSVASASMRANGNMKSNKLVKIHQNILCFKKSLTND